MPDFKADYIRDWTLEHCDTPGYRFEINRREFAVLGAGLLCVLTAAAANAAEAPIASRLHIGADGTVTVLSGKVELGQGVRTLLAQVAAEELRIAPRHVRVVLGDTALVPDDGGTWGSLTTPQTVPAVRQGAAAARAALERLGAERLGVSPETVHCEAGSVVASDGRKVTFRELASNGTPGGNIPANAQERRPVDWTVAGRDLQPLDGRAIVTGALRYPTDLRVVGLRFGRVVRSPSYRASLVRVTTPPEVTLVRHKDLLGVVGSSPAAAEAMAGIVKAEWNTEALVSDAEAIKEFRSTSTPPKPGEGGRYPALITSGDAKAAFDASLDKLEATYTLPWIAHVPLEPRAAIAEWRDGQLTIWSGTQAPFLVRRELAAAFGIPESRIRVIASNPGGAYGGKQRGECEIEAAWLARDAGAPVKLTWSREEEFTASYCRPAGIVDISASLDGSGGIAAWIHRNYNSGSASLRPPYAIPHLACEYHRAQSPLRQGSYRSLAGVANTFAREMHVTELAIAAKADALDFRLRNLDDERLRHVLQVGAERFGWGAGRKIAAGLACNIEKDARLALFTEVDTRNVRDLRVHRMVFVLDPGAVINPDSLRNQAEGALVQGMGGALFEQLRFDGRAITNPSLSAYRVPRFSDLPQIDVILVDRREIPSAGCGESPITVVAPAIGAALRAVTGKPVRDLPLNR